MTYRPEIDGLRAIAVIVVVLFHGGVPGFTGGYVGVDVFFVISGYLITSILLNDLERDRFSIVRFYERRARRILPALFFVLVAATGLAWLWMLPEQLEDYSEALLAVGLFASNIWFWRDANYFAPVAEENPLLHTWSLAVEEQFYLFFPLVLFALWRLGRRRILGLLVVASIVSLATAVWASTRYQAANFFLIPTRAWELGAGSLCAFGLGLRSPPRSAGREAMAVAGLLLLVVGVVAFDDKTPFPSLYALAPVGGTVMLVLGAQPASGLGRLLAAKPVVHIGLLSYSLYLWHQPLLAFARLRVDGTLSLVHVALLLMLSLVLAELSWRFVEQPFRSHAARPLPRRTIFVGSIMGLAMLLAVGAAGDASHGAQALWAARHPEMSAAYRGIKAARADRGRTFDDGGCRFNVEQLNAPVLERVRRCATQHGPGIVVVGDSHSIDLYAGLYAQSSAPFLVGLTSGGCRPHSPAPGCSYDKLLEAVEAHPTSVGRVVFTQSGAYLMRLPSGESGRRIFKRLTSTSELDPADYQPAGSRIEANLRYLEDLARGREVVWVGPRLEPHISVRRVVELGCDHRFELREGLAEAFAQLDQAIASLASTSPVTFVSQIDAVAVDIGSDFGTCDAFFWSDGDHWTTAGAKRFVGRLLERHPFLARQPLSPAATDGEGSR